MGREECDFASCGGGGDGDVMVPVDTMTGRWGAGSTFEFRTGFGAIVDGKLERLAGTDCE